MSDAEMMRFMASCMLGGRARAQRRDAAALAAPAPRRRAHPRRRDDEPDQRRRRRRRSGWSSELFEGGIVYVPYTRPGFPLARSVSEMVDRDPGRRDRARPGAPRARDLGRRRARVPRASHPGGGPHRTSIWRPPGAAGVLLGQARGTVPPADQRRRLAEVVLPVVRGELSEPDRVILHFDDGDDLLATLAAERTARAGSSRDGDAGAPAPRRPPAGLARSRPRRRRRTAGRPGAEPARRRAGRVRGVPPSPRRRRRAPPRRLGQGRPRARARHDHGVQRQARRRDRQPLLSRGAGDDRERRGGGPIRVHRRARRVRVRALAAGAAQGGRADREGPRHPAAAPARRRGDRRRERDRPRAPRSGSPRREPTSWWRTWTARRRRAWRRRRRRASPDARSAPPWTCATTPASTRSSAGPCSSSAGWTRCSTPPARRRASRRSPRSGGRTCSASSRFTTSARSPRSARAAAVMRRQGLGGSIVASVSKAALVPGKEAVAYGGSKAALLQALRVAAVELGPRRDPGERDQRRPGGHAAVPAVRAGARGQPRGDGRGAAGDVSPAESDGCEADSARRRWRTWRCCWRATSSGSRRGTS